MADSSGDLDLEAFRAEARSWLEANFPEGLRGKAGLAMQVMEGGPLGGDVEVWRRRMGEKGWGAPTWPTKYGGGGLSVAQARVLGQEMARIGAFNPVEGRAICVPTRRGKRGNPVLLARRFFPELMKVAGDIGARDLIAGHSDLVTEVEMDNDGVLTDIDTPQALARLAATAKIEA